MECIFAFIVPRMEFLLRMSAALVGLSGNLAYVVICVCYDFAALARGSVWEEYRLSSRLINQVQPTYST